MCFLFCTLRLSLCLALSGWGRRATGLPQRGLLVLLWRRRLTMSTLHSLSLGARLIRLSSSGRRRDLLTRSWLCTSARLPAFTRSHGRRRAELLRRRTLLVTLRRRLFRPTSRGIWLLTGPSRWLTTLLLLLRRRTLQS